MRQDQGRRAEPGSGGRSRRALTVVLVVLPVFVAATLYVLRGQRGVSHGPATQQSSVLSYPTPPESPAPSRSSRANATRAIAAPTAAGEPPIPAIFGEDLSQGLDLPPPPLPSGPPPPRPPRPEMSEAEKIERRELGLARLDDTVARLEKEAQEQEQAGDADGAHLTRWRLERLKAVRIQRRAELDELKQHRADSPAAPANP